MAGFSMLLSGNGMCATRRRHRVAVPIVTRGCGLRLSLLRATAPRCFRARLWLATDLDVDALVEEAQQVPDRGALGQRFAVTPNEVRDTSAGGQLEL